MSVNAIHNTRLERPTVKGQKRELVLEWNRPTSATLHTLGIDGGSGL